MRSVCFYRLAILIDKSIKVRTISTAFYKRFHGRVYARALGRHLFLRLTPSRGSTPLYGSLNLLGGEAIGVSRDPRFQ